MSNDKQAFVSTLILSTSFYIIFSGRNGQWDIFAHAFMIFAIYHLFQAFESDKSQWKNWVLAGIFMGLSFMSKGPVSHFALLLPFLISYGIVFKYKNFSDDAWNFNLNQGVKDKIYQGSELLGDCADFVYGIITGNDAAFIVSDDAASTYNLERDVLFDFVKPENYVGYAVKKLDKLIIYPYDDNNEVYQEDKFRKQFPQLYNQFEESMYFESFKEIAEGVK